MKKTLLSLFLLFSLLLAGCSSPAAKREIFAMDTVMTLTVYGKNDRLLDEAQAEIHRLEALLSVNRQTSEIAAVNAGDGQWVTVSDETAALLILCKEYSQQTGGLFDVTVYPAVTAWGFTEETKTVPSNADLQALLPLIGYEKMTVKDNQVALSQGMGIDLGGIAKGYAADRLADLYNRAGASGVLSLGGNVLTVGQKPDGTPFTVAVQDPADPGATLGTLQVSGGTAVVTSGDYQRYFEQDGVRYHHILDPRTGRPADGDLTSVTVVAGSAAYADALSTALFVMGLEKGVDYVNQTQGVEALFVTKDQRILTTKGLVFTPIS